MKYEFLCEKTEKFIEKRDELSEEKEIFSEEIKKVEEIAYLSEKLDVEIQAEIASVTEEYISEGSRLDERTEEAELRKTELGKEIISEREKLSEAAGKLAGTECNRYSGSAHKAFEECSKYIELMDELIEKLGSDSETEGTVRKSGFIGIKKTTDKKPEVLEDIPALCRFNVYSDPFFTGNMQKKLDSSKFIDVRKIYGEYSDRIVIADSDFKEGAFYDRDHGVFFNAEVNASGDFIYLPYQAAFHEFAHNIDYLIGGGEPVSENFESGALMRALFEDFKEMKGGLSNNELIEKISGECSDNGWTLKDTAGLSDILECFTDTDYPLGSGHGVKYWNETGRLPCKEFFAETLDGAAANERSYNVMKKYFPKSVETVHRILKEYKGELIFDG